MCSGVSCSEALTGMGAMGGLRWLRRIPYMVKLQTEFLRWLAGVASCSDQALYLEFAVTPLHVLWSELVFKWWNSLVGAKGSLFHDVFRADLRLALDGKECWSAIVLRILACLGYDGCDRAPGEDRVTALSQHRLPVDALVDTVKQRFSEDWRSERLTVEPRSFVSDGRSPGVKMCRAQHWMGPAKYLSTYIPLQQRVCLSRFRLGCWPLECNRPNGRSRSDRVCPLCLDGEEDERHVLLECAFYAVARSQLALPAEPEMKGVMGMDNQPYGSQTGGNPGG